MNPMPDAHWMARALRLARKGLYTTRPNPRVGCVLVKEGQVVGEGWHHRAGAPHAERVALEAAGEAARGATAYVTLEPCSHHGRTPPCADALVAAGVSRVVAAMEDPNPLVAGGGLDRLRAAGIQVRVGVLEAEARALNPGFVKRMTRGLPWVRCKLAMSLEGRTALADGESRWITAEAARRDVHRLRARSDAIVTGIGTVLADDPSLDVRLDPAALEGVEEAGVFPSPLRVVLDSRLRMPADARMLELPGETLVVCLEPAPVGRARLEGAGARVEALPESGGQVDIESTLRFLAGQEINEVMLETGPTLAGAMLHGGWVDELLIYMAPHLMGDSARGLFSLPAIRRMGDRVALKIRDIRALGRDWRIEAVPDVRPAQGGERPGAP